MNIKVMYHTTTGNTKKVAEAIGETLGAIPEPILEDSCLDKEVDVLFIGDGNYVSKINSYTEKFIKTLDKSKVKKVAAFGTYGGQTNALLKMKESLKEQGLNVADEVFGCKGKAWLLFNRNHPNVDDLNAAKKFAQNVVKNI
ncbi:MAG: flavodoxin family protein [Clostridium sp.]|nr:flavodoxin family protein [Clostridium sp.]